ncbi:MAG: response regulator transcription factor [Rhodothermales bacterium]|nr:response regulator transcription factor [Rhodothermales bacterium]
MTRLIIIEPTRLRADFIASALSNEKGFDVVASVTDLEQVSDHAGHVDVALLSMGFPNGEALETLWGMVTNDPCIRVVAIGVSDSEGAILQAIEAGASGYVLESDSFDKLIRVVRSVSDHAAYAAPHIVAALMRRLRDRTGMQNTLPNLGRYDSLTDREQEILRLLASGLSNRAISAQLFIEYGTVKNHVHNILSKLRVGSRKEAASCIAYA